MAISEAEKKRIWDLRNEGQRISEIQKAFPHLGYWEIWSEFSTYGICSARGTKRKIANDCKRLKGATTQAEREKLAKEIDALAAQLYEMIKNNKTVISEMRRLLNK